MIQKSSKHIKKIRFHDYHAVKADFFLSSIIQSLFCSRHFLDARSLAEGIA